MLRRLDESIAVRLAFNNLDGPRLRSSSQYSGHAVGTVERRVACVEKVVDLAGSQRSLDVRLREHRPNPLEPVTAELHTHTM